MTAILLPTEILLDIGSHVDQQAHHSLTLVSRRFKSVFSSLLYSHLVLRYAEEEVKTAQTDPPTQHAHQLEPQRISVALLDLLVASPELRAYARSIQMDYISLKSTSTNQSGSYPFPPRPTSTAVEEFLESILETIRTLPQLGIVMINQFPLQTEWILRLASTDAGVKLHLRQADIYGKIPPSSNLDRAPRPWTNNHAISVSELRMQHCRCYIDWPAFFANWLASKPTTTLALTRIAFHPLYRAYCSFEGITLSHITVLEVGCVNNNELEVLFKMSALRTLHLFDLSYIHGLKPGDIPPGKGSNAVLLHLQDFLGHHTLVEPFTAGRRLRKLSSYDNGASKAESRWHLGPFFGSETMVQSLTWKSVYDYRGLFKYIASSNAAVQDLDVEPILQPNSNTEDDFNACFVELQSMTELRSLRFPLLRAPARQRDVDWERTQCQRLKDRGNTHLVSVALSKDLTWIRHPDDNNLWQPRYKTNDPAT